MIDDGWKWQIRCCDCSAMGPLYRTQPEAEAGRNHRSADDRLKRAADACQSCGVGSPEHGLVAGCVLAQLDEQAAEEVKRK